MQRDTNRRPAEKPIVSKPASRGYAISKQSRMRILASVIRSFFRSLYTIRSYDSNENRESIDSFPSFHVSRAC